MIQTNPMFNRPSILDGLNYSYWKVRMRASIKSIDARAWRTVQNGWAHPKVQDEDGDMVRKPEIQWSRDESDLATFNDKSLNVIF